jgi:gliding motility-associated-like protein
VLCKDHLHNLATHFPFFIRKNLPANSLFVCLYKKLIVGNSKKIQPTVRLLPFLLLITTPAISQLNADFSVTNTTGCTPFTVQFKDISTGSPTSWFWDFGDGQTSSLQNPAITYTTSGSFSVRLIIKTATEQDYEEKDNYINVSFTPDVDFFVVGGDSGCVNLQASFQDNSDMHGAPVKSWLWDFGDGGTSSLQNPSHTYTAESKYDVSLTIQTTQGCSATRIINNAVMAGDKPDPAFSASPLDGCASTFRDFKNKSGKASAYLWDFGDNGTSDDKNPHHHYRDTGWFDVKLLVSENGCIDSTEIKSYIHVSGAVAKFNPAINCADRFTVDFRDNSKNETSRLWHFGDGQTSVNKAVTYTYAASGIYYVELDVTGTSCNDTAYDTLHIKATTPQVEILPAKNVYCRNDSLSFVVTNFDSIVTRSFAWNSGDGFESDFGKNLDTIGFVYRKNGNFQPAVYIKDDHFCIDTTFYNGKLAINAPTADFNANATGCTNAPVNFKDASISGNNAPIAQWLWSYGDGSTANTSGPLNYTYSFPVVYNAMLTVTDVNGCTDTITHPVQIFDAPVVDAGADTFACANTNLTLNPNGADSYVWLANTDLSCTNCTNPVATPQQSTTYFVTGTTGGCSASDSVKIKVQTKELITAQPNSYQICAGDSVALNVIGADSYSWSPSNTLNNSTIQNPVAFPATNTAYTITGKDSNNCFSDMAVVNVTVNPSPTVNIIDSSVQLLLGSSYTIATTASIDAQNPVWTPANGLSCYNCLQPVATVGKTTVYTLKVSNQNGCVDSDKITITSLCTNESVFLPNTFSPNNDGMNDYFYPRTPSDVNIISLTVFNRWGQTVFQKRNFSSNNAMNGWDGKYKNNLQNADVYVYVMELQCSGNNSFLKRGNITLMR